MLLSLLLLGLIISNLVVLGLLVPILVVIGLSIKVANIGHNVEVNVGAVSKLADVNVLVYVSAVFYVYELINVAISILAINTNLIWMSRNLI